MLSVFIKVSCWPVDDRGQMITIFFYFIRPKITINLFKLVHVCPYVCPLPVDESSLKKNILKKFCETE